ncbi:CYTH domain-containing protein [Desulfopila sp. IMCC35008]|uniref:CYTH domain-containing protein n=1 Tax=Desulfopila sp. IMCC35008 TaxID=2653858 RepID=UPI0013D2F3E6|nr:CYTH domain-containing protein [Desulfopila sp. IMCC35008]
MGFEIEKKFLIKNDSWKIGAIGTAYRQGYLSGDKGRTVRVRTVGSTGFITIKGPTQNGRRLEYEYEIPESDVQEMLETLCLSPIIEKVRYLVDYKGFTWEIDVFSGVNEGLIVAEIELESIHQDFALPPWVGQEVTDDPRYYNSNLSRHPFQLWKDHKE